MFDPLAFRLHPKIHAYQYLDGSTCIPCFINEQNHVLVVMQLYKSVFNLSMYTIYLAHRP